MKTVKEYLDHPDDDKMGEIGAVNFHLPYFETFTKFMSSGLNQVEGCNESRILKTLKGSFDFTSRFLEALV